MPFELNVDDVFAAMRQSFFRCATEPERDIEEPYLLFNRDIFSLYDFSMLMFMSLFNSSILAARCRGLFFRRVRLFRFFMRKAFSKFCAHDDDIFSAILFLRDYY